MEEKRKIRLGIMGGTFDPIHYGHLVTAAAAHHKYGLDKVIFVPAGNPPHKAESRITDPEERYMMCILATISNPSFQVSRLEIDREGYSYTNDTVIAFKELCQGNCEIFFISGADAVLDIIHWKNVGELLSNCTFVAATRPGFNLEEARDLPEEFLSKIRFMTIPALAISSTDIRKRVRQGRPITYLLPETVESYILKQGFYLD